MRVLSRSRTGRIRRRQGYRRAGENWFRRLLELSEASGAAPEQESLCLQTRRHVRDAGRQGVAGVVSSVEPEHTDRKAHAEDVCRKLSRGGKNCRYVG